MMNKRKLALVVIALAGVAIPVVIGIPALRQLWRGNNDAAASAPSNRFPEQRRQSQEDLWLSRLRQHEQAVRSYYAELRVCHLDLERRQKIANIEQLLSDMSGEPVAVISPELKQNSEVIRDVCDTYTELLKDAQAQMKTARVELERTRTMNRLALKQAAPAPASTSTN